MNEVIGTVKKVINKSRYTNYAKFIFNSTNLGVKITCIGRIDVLFPGLTLKLDGNFTDEECKNFAFEKSTIISLPDLIENKKASKMLLTNSPFNFTGNEFNKIYKAFQEDTIKVAIEETDKLLGINNLDVSKVLDVINYLSRETTLKNLSNFLNHYLVPTSYAVKLYSFYGNQALHFLQNHPVKCGLDGAIPINIARYLSKAQFLPISTNDNLTALIIEAIGHFENQGHTYVESEELLDFLTKYTQVKERQTYMYAMKYALDNNFIKFMEYNKKYLVYKTQTFNNEQLIANNIVKIRGQNSIDFNISYEIGLVENSIGFKYSKEQVQAIKAAFSNTFSIITGPAGCGKTSVLTGITKIFRKKFSSKILLCAPTGKAANRMTETTGMSAYTVHRALGMKPLVDDIDLFTSDIFLQYDLIIMDEASMLDNDLAAVFFKSIKPGTKVVLLGDSNQLPSVGCGNILEDVIETNLIPITKLTTVFRQGATSSIIINANKIINDETDFVFDDNFVFIQKNDSLDVANTAINLYINISQRINVNNLILLSPFRSKTVTGCDKLNAILEPYQNPSVKAFYTTSKCVFKVGDLVIRTQNDNKLDVCNGAIGVISDINQQGFVVDFDLSKTVSYPFSEFANFDLAYANTIHKSQGSEYDTAIIICAPEHKSMLNNKTLYTAITRAKNKVIMVGDLQTFKESVLKKYDIVRNTMLKQRLILASKL